MSFPGREPQCLVPYPFPGGYPHPVPNRGVPKPGQDGSTPCQGLGVGTPSLLGLDQGPIIRTGWVLPPPRDRATGQVLAMQWAVCSCPHAGGLSCYTV